MIFVDSSKNQYIINSYYERVGIFMLKGLLIFQSLIILLMFLAAVMFIIQGLFIQSILYLAFGGLFTGYVLSNRKHKPE